ncbi:MAG: hypothetical protein JKY10_11670, partial [Cohaesibacteraceae bacterium]|nr:hypothetical protein [Cohaesibacteraceae bacterium]
MYRETLVFCRLVMAPMVLAIVLLSASKIFITSNYSPLNPFYVVEALILAALAFVVISKATNVDSVTRSLGARRPLLFIVAFLVIAACLMVVWFVIFRKVPLYRLDLIPETSELAKLISTQQLDFLVVMHLHYTLELLVGLLMIPVFVLLGPLFLTVLPAIIARGKISNEATLVRGWAHYKSLVVQLLIGPALLFLIANVLNYSVAYVVRFQHPAIAAQWNWLTQLSLVINVVLMVFALVMTARILARTYLVAEGDIQFGEPEEPGGHKTKAIKPASSCWSGVFQFCRRIGWQFMLCLVLTCVVTWVGFVDKRAPLIALAIVLVLIWSFLALAVHSKILVQEAGLDKASWIGRAKFVFVYWVVGCIALTGAISVALTANNLMFGVMRRVGEASKPFLVFS